MKQINRYRWNWTTGKADLIGWNHNGYEFDFHIQKLLDRKAREEEKKTDHN